MVDVDVHGSIKRVGRYNMLLAFLTGLNFFTDSNFTVPKFIYHSWWMYITYGLVYTSIFVDLIQISLVCLVAAPP